MQFRRKRDGIVAEAKQWFRHGDHPSVLPATEDLLPNVESPSKRFGMIEAPSGRTAVFAGDWIVSLETGLTIALPERVFRQAYEAVAG